MKAHFRPAYLIVGILALFLIGFLISCSEDPTDTGGDDGAFNSTGDIDPLGEQDFLLSTVDLGHDIRGTLEIWVFDLTIESDSAVSFDIAIANKTDRDVYPPIHFVITKIIPNSINVLNADGFTPDQFPFFDFSDDIGDDGVLAAGETTGRVKVRFGWPHPMPFAIGFRLYLGQKPIEGVIGGVVFTDRDQDGHFDPEHDTGIAGIPIELRPTAGEPTRPRVIDTNREGRYGFEGLPAGVYKVTIVPLPGMKLTTPPELLVTLIELPDGTVSSFFDANFGATPLVPQYERVFGPIPVGPASPFGARVDTMVVIPPPPPTFREVDYVYFVRVEPPMLMGPYPIYIDRVEVAIDDELVFRFECPLDSLCPPPYARVMLERGTDLVGEHNFKLGVMGDENSFLHISVEREWREVELP